MNRQVRQPPPYSLHIMQPKGEALAEGLTEIPTPAAGCQAQAAGPPLVLALRYLKVTETRSAPSPPFLDPKYKVFLNL